MGGNSRNSTDCSTVEMAFFTKQKGGLVSRINTLLVVNTILMAVIAVMGAYRHRYRHHPLIRFIYLAATTLFLPIVSYVVSAIENPYNVTNYVLKYTVITAKCEARLHVFSVMLWIGLVQIVGTNAIATVAGDYREGRSIAPPAVQLVQAIWTSYLAYTAIESNLHPPEYFGRFPGPVTDPKKRSLALGSNPRLIVGYMEQLQDGVLNCTELVSEHVPPPLILMKEDTLLVEKQPHGYSLTRMNNNGLVTLDRVWQLNVTLKSGPTTQHKDLCLSFAMFKLLRCRFARYKVSEAIFAKANNFICHVLLEDSDDERVFGVIAHELSFLNDYYYTSLPVSYSKSWLPIVSTCISLLSIGYCLLVTNNFIMESQSSESEQITCSEFHCDPPYMPQGGSSLQFGALLFDQMSLSLLVALVVLVEAREIMSYICSNWTKVALTCHYVSHTSWQQSPVIRKCVGLLLRTRCKFMVHWEDKMNQSSILVLRPRRNLVALLRHLLHLPDQKKVPRPVKAAVVDAVRRYKRTGRQTNGATHMQLHVNNLLWTSQGTKGTADVILVCHVATSILEVRSRRQNKPLSNHEIAATHISQYCAYLDAYCPELLPDDAAWCRSLYKAVNKDAARVLRSDRVSPATPEAEDQQLVKLLSEQSKHHVLKDGAELGRLLTELPEGEEVAWKALAEFWSDTLVSVAAACDNIDEHAEAVARGGELVTLLWALLAHVGSVDDDTADAAATHGAPDAV
uniref:Uncharacterized protein n=1 Tax=Aegilops tauschii TaxID=37682 RepID=M8CZ49_AEGTA